MIQNLSNAPYLVYGALVHVARVLLVLRHRLDVYDGHDGEELHHVRLDDAAGGRVPARALHVQPVDIGALARRRAVIQ